MNQEQASEEVVVRKSDVPWHENGPWTLLFLLILTGMVLGSHIPYPAVLEAGIGLAFGSITGLLLIAERNKRFRALAECNTIEETRRASLRIRVFWSTLGFASVACAIGVLCLVYSLCPHLSMPWARFILDTVGSHLPSINLRLSIPSMVFSLLLVASYVYGINSFFWYRKLPD